MGNGVQNADVAPVSCCRGFHVFKELHELTSDTLFAMQLPSLIDLELH